MTKDISHKLLDFSYGEMTSLMADRDDSEEYNRSASFIKNFDTNIFGNLKTRDGLKLMYKLEGGASVGVQDNKNLTVTSTPFSSKVNEVKSGGKTLLQNLPANTEIIRFDTRSITDFNKLVLTIETTANMFQPITEGAITTSNGTISVYERDFQCGSIMHGKHCRNITCTGPTTIQAFNAGKNILSVTNMLYNCKYKAGSIPLVNDSRPFYCCDICGTTVNCNLDNETRPVVFNATTSNIANITYPGRCNDLSSRTQVFTGSQNYGLYINIESSTNGSTWSLVTRGLLNQSVLNLYVPDIQAPYIRIRTETISPNTNITISAKSYYTKSLNSSVQYNDIRSDLVSYNGTQVGNGIAQVNEFQTSQKFRLLSSKTSANLNWAIDYSSNQKAPKVDYTTTYTPPPVLSKYPDTDEDMNFLGEVNPFTPLDPDLGYLYYYQHHPDELVQGTYCKVADLTYEYNISTLSWDDVTDVINPDYIISPDHIFDTDEDRDLYYTENPTELIEPRVIKYIMTDTESTIYLAYDNDNEDWYLLEGYIPTNLERSFDYDTVPTDLNRKYYVDTFRQDNPTMGSYTIFLLGYTYYTLSLYDLAPLSGDWGYKIQLINVTDPGIGLISIDKVWFKNVQIHSVSNIVITNGKLVSMQFPDLNFPTIDPEIDEITFDCTLYTPTFSLRDSAGTLLETIDSENETEFFSTILDYSNSYIDVALTNPSLQIYDGLAVYFSNCLVQEASTPNISSIGIIKMYYSEQQQYCLFMQTGAITVYDIYNEEVKNPVTGWNSNYNFDYKNLRYCQIGNKIIVCSGNKIPLVITLDLLNLSTPFSIAPIDSTNFPKTQFNRIKNPTQTAQLTFTRSTGEADCSALEKSNINFTNYLDQIISDGISEFRITKILGTKKCSGYWLVQAADLSTIDVTSTIWDNRPWWYITGNDISWDSSPNGYPRTCAYVDERLIFGGTYSKPLTLWASKIGDYFNFVTGSSLDNDAKQLDISNNDNNEIKALFNNKGLQIFTRTTEFLVTEGGNFSKVDKIGSLGINETSTPKMCGINTLYITGNNKHLAFLKQGQFYQTQLSNVFTQDCFETINEPLQFDCSINETQGNQIWIVNTDSTIAKGTFMMTGDGEKIGFNRYISNRGFIASIVFRNDVYFITTDFWLCKIDKDNTLDYTYYTSLNNSRVIQGSFIRAGSSYRVLNNATKQDLGLYTATGSQNDGVITLETDFTGDVVVGEEYSCEWASRNFSTQGKTTSLRTRIVMANILFYNALATRIILQNKIYMLQSNKLKAVNLGVYQQECKFNIKADSLHPIHLLSADISIDYGLSI